jgi:hypothetical protein
VAEKSFKSGGKSYRAFFTSGNGGNKVLAFPELDLTGKLLTDYILAAVEQ